MKTYGKFYIDGQWVDPLGSKTFELINPATETPFGTLSLGTSEDVDRAVKAARRAFPSFSSTTKGERIALLQRIVDAFQARERDLMAAVTLEMGAPMSLKAQTSTAVEAFKQAIVTLKDYEFETRLGTNIVRREPIGVCGLIAAWNWPLQLLSTKLSAALAAGCTVVVKPSEFTPVSAIVLAEVLHAANLPKGVFNLVNGDGPTVGNAISKHPDIDLVSFTGSTRAGILVAEAAAPTVKRVCQELGGKSANVVLPDADLGRRRSVEPHARLFEQRAVVSFPDTNPRARAATRGSPEGDTGGGAESPSGGSAGSRDDDGSGGEQGTVREDPEVHPNRNRRGSASGMWRLRTT